MYTVRDLDGSLQDMLDPACRKVQFSDSPEIVTVCTHLRALWTTLPPTSNETLAKGEKPHDETGSEVNPMKYAVSQTLKPNHDGYEGLQDNTDTTTLDTQWRKTIAHDWNHVYWDVMNFLPEVSCSVGHIHPPSHDLLGIPFTGATSEITDEDDVSKAVLRKKWDRNVLLLPTYLAKGVVIRTTSLTDSQEEPPEKTLGSFDGSNPFEIWYVRAGVELLFHVEGEYQRDANNSFAAVMAVGLLCTKSHGENNSCEFHGDDDDDAVPGEGPPSG